MIDVEDMFCFQCEQTVKPNGCQKVGVCSKTPLISSLQDLIISGCGYCEQTEEDFTYNIFMTLTNVNFNEDDHFQVLEKLNSKIISNDWQLAFSQLKKRDFQLTRRLYSPDVVLNKLGKDIGGLVQFGIQGVKGASAYAQHCFNIMKLNEEKNQILSENILKLMSIHKLLITKVYNNTSEVLQLLISLGEINFQITSILYYYNTKLGGKQKITTIHQLPIPGPAILVSGHDYKDLMTICVASQKENVNVYTHGELFPAGSYENFKGLVAGHFGGAWWKQQKEFELFPGPVVMTSNCLMKPKSMSQIKAVGVVGYNDMNKLDMDKLIQEAKQGGFKDQAHCNSVFNQLNIKQEVEGVGLSFNVFQDLKNDIVSKIQTNQIEKLVFIGGCDGQNTGRNKFRQVSQKVGSKDLIITGACGRFRINDQSIQNVAGLPKILDIGQCNDVWSLIQIVKQIELEIPTICESIELWISWYEQKAIIQLLSLLSQGFRNMKIGPTKPVCLTDSVFALLSDTFGIQLI
ncbi:Hybrid cluster protein 1 [Spironucleus salmonicida]|uniref:Hybrid cluster protein 1 n=1 Tax=Spironucleus salmonicida TaxID=348837 RepID=K7REM5_9EUKA|nr:hybrid cluster protein 1 [Spironucleus salmonicida]KAH0570651.1 Hybrid cluster protein 1 [Spironucleus salmonicida]|eukprot:EST47448.1 Hybrid cluster protein 1 [Spironucleus salmonicida]